MYVNKCISVAYTYIFRYVCKQILDNTANDELAIVLCIKLYTATQLELSTTS